jgi:hypothetical protein
MLPKTKGRSLELSTEEAPSKGAAAPERNLKRVVCSCWLRAYCVMADMPRADVLVMAMSPVMGVRSGPILAPIWIVCCLLQIKNPICE